MRKDLLLILLLAAAPAFAKAPRAKATAEPTPAPNAPAAPQVNADAPTKISVRLKDGQALDASLLKYDRYFLSVSNSAGTGFDIPWAEVEAVDGPELGAELGLLRARLVPGPGPVASVVAARAPGTAFAQALWPGFLLHGAGHRYAGDNDTFVSLAGAELFGVVVGGFGLSELLGETKAGEHKDTALALSVGGGAIFALSWFYDMAFAPGAAVRTNRAKGLALEPRLDGIQLSYKF